MICLIMLLIEVSNPPGVSISIIISLGFFLVFISLKEFVMYSSVIVSIGPLIFSLMISEFNKRGNINIKDNMRIFFIVKVL